MKFCAMISGMLLVAPVMVWAQQAAPPAESKQAGPLLTKVMPLAAGQESAMSDNDLVMRFQYAKDAIRGAAPSAQGPVVERLKSEIAGKTIQVDYAEIESLEDAHWIGFLPDAVTLVDGSSSWIHTNESKSSPFGSTAVVTVTKSLPTTVLHFVLLVGEYASMGEYRVGQKVSFVGQVAAFWERGPNGPRDVWITNPRVQILLETKLVRCSNGHEYPAATGYKFCFQCGQPLH